MASRRWPLTSTCVPVPSKTTLPIMHCNDNRKKDTMRKYCPKMNHRAMEGYCAVEWVVNTAHPPTADGRDRGVGFSERKRERIRVRWADFCVVRLIWWNGRWSILMYSWIDWRVPCVARGPWNSPRVRRHTLHSIHKHSNLWRLLTLSRRPWICCNHLCFREGLLYGHTHSFGFLQIWSITTKHLKVYYSQVRIDFTPKLNDKEEKYTVKG